jgi:hypothetical protein
MTLFPPEKITRRVHFRPVRDSRLCSRIVASSAWIWRNPSSASARSKSFAIMKAWGIQLDAPVSDLRDQVIRSGDLSRTDRRIYAGVRDGEASHGFSCMA